MEVFIFACCYGGVTELLTGTTTHPGSPVDREQRSVSTVCGMAASLKAYTRGWYKFTYYPALGQMGAWQVSASGASQQGHIGTIRGSISENR